jgi:tagatose-6-phosphate ketose/aldose isomerase
MRALAVEACLKVLEMTAGRTVTLSETFLGVRHGPLSFLTEDSLVMCFISASAHRRLYEADLVQELRSKNLGTLVGIGTEKTMPDLFDTWIPSYSEGLRDELRIPFDIPFAQLLAFHLSVQQGLDPDNPSPAGIITRTVQRFAIHNE